ncbi:MAG TPA: hypothetical protein VD838_18340, partial [Anaeromyxobacteraceae bacterium]|nr:hypothetical protein [Anaeromyxobacteraceae bacterium]
DQESGIELALKALNEIHHATEDTVASTQSVAEEARSLTELASSLRAATTARPSKSDDPAPTEP